MRSFEPMNARRNDESLRVNRLISSPLLGVAVVLLGTFGVLFQNACHAANRVPVDDWPLFRGDAQSRGGFVR